MTRPNHCGQQNIDYWVDSHYISAYSGADAIKEARYLYQYEPHTVRLWTDDDWDQQ